MARDASSLIRFEDGGEPLVAPVLIAALEGWVDAGGAASTAAEHLARDGEVIARFDGDEIFDYRSRRPTLELVEGMNKGLDWPELAVHRVRREGRDLLVMTGPEPDHAWRAFNSATITAASRWGVVRFIAMGAIGFGVPHTRPTPVMGTATPSDLLPSEHPRPEGILRVPAAAISTLEATFIEHGIPAVGFWARTPHYLTSFDQAALALVDNVARHLGLALPREPLEQAVEHERVQLEQIIADRPDVLEYVQRLETMTEEEQSGFRTTSGDEIAGEIERYLRDVRGDGSY